MWLPLMFQWTYMYHIITEESIKICKMLLKASAHSFKRLLHGFLKVAFSLSMHI